MTSALTRSCGDRFTTASGSNIPNGSSQIAKPRCVILTSRLSLNCSIVQREEDLPGLLLILIVFSNRDQIDSVAAVYDRRSSAKDQFPLRLRRGFPRSHNDAKIHGRADYCRRP